MGREVLAASMFSLCIHQTMCGVILDQHGPADFFFGPVGEGVVIRLWMYASKRIPTPR